MNTKRLFFGLEAIAPWPEEFPSEGKLLDEKDRHLTLVFLGDVEESEKLLSSMPLFPKPPFPFGLCGYFHRVLFFPHVVAWEVRWLEKKAELFSWRKEFIAWLKEQRFSPKEKEFLSHVTLARKPASLEPWKKHFSPLPCFFGSFHLFQSLGHSRYQSLWHFPLLAPFEEREHTADLAFFIRGSDFSELCLHGWLALSFQFPSLIRYVTKETCHCLEDVITALNRNIARADQREGVPLKAVSFHGALRKNEWLEWEMIVDV